MSKDSHNGPRKVVLARGNAEGQYNLLMAIMTWHPFINTIIIKCLSGSCQTTFYRKKIVYAKILLLYYAMAL